MKVQEALNVLDLPKDEPGVVADVMAITKARLTMLVLITTFVGFCMGSGETMNWTLLLHAFFGTALVAGAAAVLNQVIEVDVDRLMGRTRTRPLPAGRMKRSSALMMGLGVGIAGVVYLALLVNHLSAALAAATILIYLLLYTPLKRRSSLCIMVGAVSGGIPPVIGWTAASDALAPAAWILFGVLFLWQIPHFSAIAWMYRDEYAQAGFIMLRRRDTAGVVTAWESVVCTIALLLLCVVPFTIGMVSVPYLIGAAILNGVFVFCAVRFLLDRTRVSARRLFFASIIFLPLILGLMVFTKI